MVYSDILSDIYSDILSGIFSVSVSGEATSNLETPDRWCTTMLEANSKMPVVTTKDQAVKAKDPDNISTASSSDAAAARVGNIG